jgi:hypothetical protein
VTWVFNRSVNDNVLIAGGFFEAKKPHPDWLKYNKVSIDLCDGTRRIYEEEMPRELRMVEKRELPNMFMAYGGMWIVDASAREIIENLDPGLHQFFSINVQFPDGTSPPGEWFSMNITTVRKTMIDAESAIKHSVTKDQTFTSKSGVTKTKKGHEMFLVDFDAKRITVGPEANEGANLWREKGHQRDLILFSDKLHDALHDAGLTTAKKFRAQLSTES